MYIYTICLLIDRCAQFFLRFLVYQNTALFSTFLRPPSSVRPFVTAVTSQFSSIIWWFSPWKPHIFSDCISSRLIILTNWITWTTWTPLTTDQCSVQPSTSYYSPVQLSTAQLQPSTSKYSPSSSLTLSHPLPYLPFQKPLSLLCLVLFPPFPRCPDMQLTM